MDDPHKEKDWFWKIFGGAIIGVISILIATLFNYVQSSIADLRFQIIQITKDASEFESKDFGSIKEKIVACETQINSINSKDLVSLKETLNVINNSVKDYDKDQQSLKEKDLSFDEKINVIFEKIKKLETDIQSLKEKIAALEVTKK